MRPGCTRSASVPHDLFPRSLSALVCGFLSAPPPGLRPRPRSEDYIECESCNEWYHFSCEGLDEADPPDVYSCKRCRQLTAKGQKVSAQERRRNKAKTNEYMSQMVRERSKAAVRCVPLFVSFDNKQEVWYFVQPRDYKKMMRTNVRPAFRVAPRYTLSWPRVVFRRP